MPKRISKTNSVTPSAPPELSKNPTLDKCYKFIIGQSLRTLSFPTPSEIAAEMEMNDQQVYHLLRQLMELGLVLKIGRYHFRLANQFVK